MKKVTNGLAVLLLALCGAVFADEADIRKNLEPKLSGARIESVQSSPISGLFEVQIRAAEGLQIVYTDGTGNLVIQGNILDLRSSRNLTQERLDKLAAIDFKKLPLEMAVKIQRGNGKRVLAMFSDPYCPFCRQFEKKLAQLDNITIYVFMYPIIRPENADHSRAVWCSRDRGKAWLDLAAGARAKIPDAPAACDNPVDKVLALGKRMGVNSTPTLYLANGQKVNPGILPADLRDAMDEIAKAN